MDFPLGLSLSGFDKMPFLGGHELRRRRHDAWPTHVKRRRWPWVRCLVVLSLAGCSGCGLSPLPDWRLSSWGAPTFHQEIAPILRKHCTTCHRAGEAAPFSFGTYEDARRRAELIATVTERRVMPPWLPESNHGDFVNERRLSREEIDTIRRWVSAGAPEGTRRGEPPAPMNLRIIRP